MEIVENNITEKKITMNDPSKYLQQESFLYIKIIVNIVREPILILDKNLRVIMANDSFCRTFQVELKDLENKIVYELGNGQWNIPSLQRLLEEILPQNIFFNGFEFTYESNFVGKKIMMLNARQIDFKENSASNFSPIIFLAMEDVTEIMIIAEKFASHTNESQNKFIKRSHKLELNIEKLKKEIEKLKK